HSRDCPRSARRHRIKTRPPCAGGLVYSQINGLAADRPLPEHDRPVGANGARPDFTASMAIAIARLRAISGITRTHMDADTTVAGMDMHLRSCRHRKRNR